MIKRALFAIIICLLPLTALASPCDNYQRDKGTHFSDIAAKKIVDGFGGGQNIRVEIYDCDYNTFSEEFDMKIGVYWNGAIFSSNSYNIDGILTLTGSGAAANFSEIYASDSVDDLRTMQFMVGGAVALGELSEENANRIFVTNTCSGTRKLAIRYMNLSGEWENAGWWTFQEGSKMSLTGSNGEDIKTRNAIIYVYTETTDGDPRVSGDKEVYFDGRTLHASEHNADSIPIKFSLC